MPFVSDVYYEKELAYCHSGGVKVIVLQDAAETMLAFDLAKIKRDYVFVIFRCSARQRQQPVIQTLVRSAFEIIGNVFRNNKVEVRFTEYDKMIKGFLFCRLNPAFDVSIQIGRMRANGLYFDALILEYLVEFLRVGAVIISDDNLAWKTLFGSVIQEHTSLILHPTTVGRKRARSHENTPRAQVNERQGENLPPAALCPYAFNNQPRP